MKIKINADGGFGKQSTSSVEINSEKLDTLLDSLIKLVQAVTAQVEGENGWSK